MVKKRVPKRNWYVFGVVITSVCWCLCVGRMGREKWQKMRLESPQECVLINTKMYYRKGLGYILRQDKFVHLSPCPSTHLLNIFTYGISSSIQKTSKNEGERREKMRERM